jgi:hypothetical protein
MLSIEYQSAVLTLSVSISTHISGRVVAHSDLPTAGLPERHFSLTRVDQELAAYSALRPVVIHVDTRQIPVTKYALGVILRECLRNRSHGPFDSLDNEFSHALASAI